MSKPTDVRPIDAHLYFLPAHARMPLKFGAETVSYVTVARVSLTVEDRNGRSATGWGETPLSVTWVWPSSLGYEERHLASTLGVAPTICNYSTLGVAPTICNYRTANYK